MKIEGGVFSKTTCFGFRSCFVCTPLDPLPLPPPPPPPPPPRIDVEGSKYHIMKNSAIILFSSVGICLLILIFQAIFKCYLRRRRNSRVERPAEGARVDFLDQENGQEVFNHMWYVNTVGLQQSVIESITVFKYKKDERLIEGTECSVCLSEFEEDESLRLLPKCSHAFHIPCIDTWLRSHTNCPLCRAPIVSNASGSQFSVVEPNSNASSAPREDVRAENVEIVIESAGSQYDEGGTSRNVAGNDVFGALPTDKKVNDEGSRKGSSCDASTNGELRVRSSLADKLRSSEEKIQPKRRSASLDIPLSSIIHDAVANEICYQQGESLDIEVVQANPTKPPSGNTSAPRLGKSSSIGNLLPVRPNSMKRTFSSTRKIVPLRDHRSRD